MIDTITQIVLESALKEKKRWDEMGIKLNVSINVSVHNLSELAFGDYVLDLVADMGLLPEDITLERERSLMLDMVNNLAKSINVGIAISAISPKRACSL